jgi:hypothetical protein
MAVFSNEEGTLCCYETNMLSVKQIKKGMKIARYQIHRYMTPNNVSENYPDYYNHIGLVHGRKRSICIHSEVTSASGFLPLMVAELCKGG